METKLFKILLKLFWISACPQIVLSNDLNNIDVEIENIHEKDSTFLITGDYRPETHTLHKYIVSLRYKFGFGFQHICGGMPLRENVILTAAHCLYDKSDEIHKPENFIIVAGTPYSRSKIDSEKRYKVVQMLPHEDYNKTLLRNDIALIFLDRTIEVDENTISYVPITKKKPKPGVECTAFGWGRILMNGPMPDELIYVNLTILKLSQPPCFEFFRLIIELPYYVCAGEKGKEKGLCDGDSGDPLFCNGELVGISSFTGLSINSPTFFTNVYYYKSWIQEIMQIVLAYAK